MGLVHISVFGGRGMGLENSRCPDAFALPSSAAARSAPRGSGWLGLATPMDDSVREVPSRESVSAHVRGQPATARRGTVSPLTPPHQSGQLMCYKTGQVYLLLTPSVRGIAMAPPPAPSRRVTLPGSHRRRSGAGSVPLVAIRVPRSAARIVGRPQPDHRAHFIRSGCTPVRQPSSLATWWSVGRRHRRRPLSGCGPLMVW